MFAALMLQLDRFLDRWLPQSIQADAERHLRARFLLQCAGFGVVVSLVMLVVYLIEGLYPLAAAVAFSATLIAGLFVLLRATANYEFTANLSLGLASLACLLPTFSEPDLDGTIIAWLGVVPFIALMFVGISQSFKWLVFSLFTIAIYVGWHSAGYAAGNPPVPPAAVVVRAVVLVLTVFLFAVRFELDRRNALHLAQQAARERAIFIANMSHEIRTPMNGVIGMADMLLQGNIDAPTQREWLQVIRSSGRSLVTLINNLLDFNRTDASRLHLDPVTFSPRLLVHEVTLLFTPEAQRKGVGINVATSGEMPELVVADALRLRQVLTNLVANAVKFTRVGSVTVTLNALPTSLEFAVSDTGIGVPPEVLPRLFQPFDQGQPPTAREFGGTGLGLALSRQMVRLMGGELLHDAAHTPGARFVFHIPVAVPEASQTTVRPRTPVPQRHLSVLVVDDNPVNLEVATAMVERAGFTAVTATNGREAIAAARDANFVAILMDCQMPDIDGQEATRQIRKLEGPSSKVPIIALTASLLDEEVRACKAAGMNDCVAKPVSYDALAKLLSALAARATT